MTDSADEALARMRGAVESVAADRSPEAWQKLKERLTELEQRLARVAELAHDRDGDTLEARSRRLGQCAEISWDHMEEAFSKDPLKRRSTLKWAHLAAQLSKSNDELEIYRNQIDQEVLLQSDLEHVRSEIQQIRELCAGIGCADPGEECAGRTFSMVEELRQRSVCTEQHDPDRVLKVMNYTRRSLLDRIISMANLRMSRNDELAYHVLDVVHELRDDHKTPVSEVQVTCGSVECGNCWRCRADIKPPDWYTNLPVAERNGED